MKMTRKIVIVLAVFLAVATTAYAEVTDVSKWSCSNNVSNNFPDYDIEIMDCDSDGSSNFYVKVSGEPIYIHEHRTDAGKTVYHNALKTNEGNWVEVVNKRDLIFNGKLTENEGVEMSISDDNGVVVAKRIVLKLK